MVAVTILSFLLISSTLSPVLQPARARNCFYDAIYQFGDSISDVGNLIRESPSGALSRSAHLPYGETYFHIPTGRCSNGLLVIDFLANALGFPFLNPYLDKHASFDHGVNFAVSGATALDYSFFANRNIQMGLTNSSLSVQLDWFKTHLRSLCYTEADCAKKLENALFFVGEIGGNDYNYAFFGDKTMEEVKTYVPHVINTIKNAVKEVIGLGALHVVVPGNFPIGCHPIYLTIFQTNDSSAYDSDYGCLKSLNSFARYHNNQLQIALEELRQEHLEVVILYADYYNSFFSLLHNAQFLGLKKESILKACCGTGGDYNFNRSRLCGTHGVLACPNPEQQVSWDGLHLTQKAYEYMSLRLIGMLQPSIVPTKTKLIKTLIDKAAG